ncbi:MAG: ABC transporter permease [bacterium]|nr:ABC transporter permease [bacterium]MDE0289723.1 ABC transporter permease [bacterium]MDE0440178.1 ABC transporter permease [bacterium]
MTPDTVDHPTGTVTGSRIGPRSETALLHVLSLGGTLILSAGLVAATGQSSTMMLRALLDGAFLAPGRWGNTLAVAAPMLLVALGMVIGVKAGFFNIGQEGQLLIGAVAMALVGTRLQGPGPVLLIGGLLLAAAAGGAYAGLAALMRFRRGVPEVISTLLLVFVALQVVGFAITTDWFLRDLDPDRPSQAVTSAALPGSVRLPVVTVFGNEFHVGFLVALAGAAAVAFLLARTASGFKLRLLGASPNVAQQAGVSVARAGGAALFVSGALAGFAGAVMMAGGASSARLTAGFSNEIGWQGLLVALIARSRPLLCIPVAILFAALRTGAGFLAATGVDRKVVDVVQALLVLALLIPPAVQFVRGRRRTVGTADVGEG